MSAGSFIVATIRKDSATLRAADPAKAGRDHDIPEEWAKFYLKEELNRANRGR